MSASLARTHKEEDSHIQKGSQITFPCPQCGGNGYMKSTPNCYHTCLKCLGKGYLFQKEANK